MTLDRSVRQSRNDLRRQETEEETNVDEESDVEPDVERGSRVQPARARDGVEWRGSRSVIGRDEHRAARVERRSAGHQ